MHRKIGINAHLPKVRTRTKINEANLKWIRCDFNWALIEPQQSEFDYRDIDDIVEFCKANSINIVPTISYSPGWANGNKGLNYPPNDLNDWTTFVSNIVNRYKDDIEFWGLWNEPNLPEYFQGTMENYVNDIFLPASRTIKGINPNLKIVAPEISTENHAEWWIWLDRFSGLVDYYDIVTIHCYADDGKKVIEYIESGRWPRYLRWLNRLLNLISPYNQAIKSKLSKINKKAWLTETGWITNSANEEKNQRQSYEDLVNYVNANNTFEKVFFYEIVDEIDTPKKRGIIRSDYSEKPSYIYIKSLLQ